MKYKIKNMTPKSMDCIIGGCPRIYRKTSEENRCIVGSCPEVYDDGKSSYLIIGKQINAEKFGLEKKVGEGEVLIEVPKELIDNIKR